MRLAGRFLYWWAVMTVGALLLWHATKAGAVVIGVLVSMIGPAAAFLLLVAAILAAAFVWADADLEQHEAEDTEWDGP